MNELENHPIQYAIEELSGRIMYNTENTPTPEGKRWERFNRCPNCEQWSPCDVRKQLADHLAAEDVKKGE